MANLCRNCRRYPTASSFGYPAGAGLAEPAILASYVHHLVMVVAADQTDRHQLRKSLETVASCQSVSLLFNKAPSWNAAEYLASYGYATSVVPGAPTET
jgi:hypothetical protein